MSKTKILVIEDDIEIQKLLVNFLKENDFEVDDAPDGRVASYKLRNGGYDVVLMDLMLPHMAGEEVLESLRKYSNTPVIVLSAKSERETRLEVLRIGADDFIVKPFDLDEVLVRIQVVLRRIHMEKGELLDSRIQYMDLILEIDSNRLVWKDVEIALTAKELKMLELLMRYPKKTYTKAEIYEEVWQDTYYYEDNTINVHMSNLRSKLKKATGMDYIDTVWGIGYRMRGEK